MPALFSFPPSPEAASAGQTAAQGDAPIRWESLSHGTAVCISRRFRFGQDALLLAHFAQVRRQERAADFGCGCGIIPLRWHDRGHRGPCLAVELLAEPLALLQTALAASPQAAGHIVPVQADLRALPRDLCPEQSLDVIACNPPYFTGGRLSPDPARAAARHELSCTARDVCEAAYPLLRDGGRLCLCQRPERLTDVLTAMRGARIEPKRLRMVCARPDRAPWLFLVEGQKNRAPGLRILPQLITQEETGGPTAEILAIYGQTPKGELP